MAAQKVNGGTAAGLGGRRRGGPGRRGTTALGWIPPKKSSGTARLDEAGLRGSAGRRGPLGSGTSARCRRRAMGLGGRAHGKRGGRRRRSCCCCRLLQQSSGAAEAMGRWSSPGARAAMNLVKQGSRRGCWDSGKLGRRVNGEAGARTTRRQPDPGGVAPGKNLAADMVARRLSRETGER